MCVLEGNRWMLGLFRRGDDGLSRYLGRGETGRRSGELLGKGL